VVTSPGPVQLTPGGRYAPEFAVGVAVAKYADHLPLERQVRMMAREGLVVDSQTLWDQLNALARHLEPTYDALGQRALTASVINVDETRWRIMGRRNRRPAPSGACTRRPCRFIASCPANPLTKGARS
jgi:transposase